MSSSCTLADFSLGDQQIGLFVVKDSRLAHAKGGHATLLDFDCFSSHKRSKASVPELV